MARLQLVAKKRIVANLVQYLEMLNEMTNILISFMFIIINKRHLCRKRIWGETSFHRHQIRQLNFHRMIYDSDLACIKSTRMDRRTFAIFVISLKLM